MTDTSDDLALRLGIANTTTTFSVMLGLQAGFVRDSAIKPFYEPDRRPLFHKHPGNSLAFMALDALEARCIVEICEHVEHEFPDMTGHVPFSNARELIAHRTALSHPGRTKWRKDWMQDFHDEGRYRYDVKTAVIWNLKKSLNALTKGTMFDDKNFGLHIMPEMAATLHQIWQFSMNAQGLAVLPTPGQLLTQLQKFAPDYIDMLERYPDGRVPVEDGVGENEQEPA